MTNDEKNLQPAWHALEVEKVLRDLQVHENGLTVREASQRLHRYGPNQLQEAPRPGFWVTLWDQVNNFVVILLIVSSLISALLGEWIDALAILAIVVLNTVLRHRSGAPRRAGAGGIETTRRARGSRPPQRTSSSASGTRPCSGRHGFS
jgi:magnesium-transporting ATPase (P-type)